MLGPTPDAALPDAGPVRAETGLDTRPVNTTCTAPPRPRQEASLTDAFPELRFSWPVQLLRAPGDAGAFHVVELTGRVYRLPATPAATPADLELVLDLSDRINTLPGSGIYGVAFHPAFATNGLVFVAYTHGEMPGMTQRLSRFSRLPGSHEIDPASEEVLIDVWEPTNLHLGGHPGFGPDGYLYWTLGDGGVYLDPFRNAQNPSLLLGKMLRIDVDAVSPGAPYGVPPDNPFAAGGGRPEIFALGLRNAWRWSFDSLTGELWLGDVGEASFEEVNRIERGKNYGWPIREGFECHPVWIDCPSEGLTPPLAVLARGEGISITGGYVYRGQRIPDLRGAYVFGDWGNGRIFALSGSQETGYSPREIAWLGGSPVSFAEDLDGELHVLDLFAGKVLSLGPPAPAEGEFPTLLSETGCVNPDAPWEPAQGLIPYDVNAPLWSDGADKERYLALPENGVIGIDADGDMDFPTGTVLLKTFRIGERLVETRLFVRHADGYWAGYSYEWNAEGTDARLLETGKQVEVAGQRWRFPARGECMRCHTAQAGFTLGPELAQLNRDLVYPSTQRVANQLATLEHIGVLAEPLPAPVEALPRLSSISSEAPLDQRVRSYLHSNCSYCHLPGGTGLGPADFRFTTPLGDMGICDVPPSVNAFGIPGARLLAPGAPERSIIATRLGTVGRMPPLATFQIDEEALAAVEAWISATETCPGP